MHRYFIQYKNPNLKPVKRVMATDKGNNLLPLWDFGRHEQFWPLEGRNFTNTFFS